MKFSKNQIPSPTPLSRKFLEELTDTNNWLEGKLHGLGLDKKTVQRQCLDFNHSIVANQKTNGNVSPKNEAVALIEKLSGEDSMTF